MSQTTDKLTDKDKLLLVSLYETDSYKALDKLVSATTMSLADRCLNLQGDIENLRFLQGQAKSLRDLLDVIHELYKKQQENEKRKLEN